MRIPESIRKCVAFCGYLKSADGEPHINGTIFFVGRLTESRDRIVSGYAITARHVIESIKSKSIDGKVWIRLNHLSEATYRNVDLDRWYFHESNDRIDVAVCSIGLQGFEDDHAFYPIDNLASDEVTAEYEIGVGDDLFITGLFKSHFGESRNIPIVRIGNIAAMPEEPVSTRFGKIDAILAECRSIGGLSGSPVFVTLDPLVEGLKGQHLHTIKTCDGRPNVDFRLLGLLHGHFEFGGGFVDEDEQEQASADAFASVEQLRINMGIAIVVPANDILEVLSQEKFLREHEDNLREYEARIANGYFGKVDP